MLILQSLLSITSYPIPSSVIENICDEYELDMNEDATSDIRNSSNYKRAKAEAYLFLAESPNISQGGISYSFSTTERDIFRSKYQSLMNDANSDDENGVKPKYGYKGDSL